MINDLKDLERAIEDLAYSYGSGYMGEEVIKLLNKIVDEQGIEGFYNLFTQENGY